MKKPPAPSGDSKPAVDPKWPADSKWPADQIGKRASRAELESLDKGPVTKEKVELAMRERDYARDKARDLHHSSRPDRKQREESLSDTFEFVDPYVAKWQRAGVGKSTGGLKAGRRVSRADALALLSWYANATKESLRTNNSKPSDPELLRRQPDDGIPLPSGRNCRLSHRNLSRLKERYEPELDQLLK